MKEHILLSSFTGGGVREVFRHVDSSFLSGVQEVRIRCDRPLMLLRRDDELFATPKGMISPHEAEAYTVTPRDIAATMDLVSDYSVYAFEEALRVGFITLPGGHRVGLAGRCVVENGQIRTMKNIHSLHFRIAHTVENCAKPLLPLLLDENGIPHHTMLLSPPACGKTTLLRDLTRLISNGDGIQRGLTVGVVDERSELAGCHNGLPQNDLGIRTDVLDGCPKAQGMHILLRAMSPRVLIVDELGKREELDAVEDILHAGIRLICTAHAETVEGLANRPILQALIAKRFIKRFVVLDSKPHAGHIAGVFDENGRRLDKEVSVWPIV